MEFVRGEGIDSHEGQHVGLRIFHVSHVLNGLFKYFVLARLRLELPRNVTHTPHYDVHINVLQLLCNAVRLGNHKLVA